MKLFGLIMLALFLVSLGFSLGISIERDEHDAELAKSSAAITNALGALQRCGETMQRHDREWKAAANQCLLLVDLARTSCP